MKITYDKTTDAMYIKLNEKLLYKSSKKISDDVLIDYSNDGKVIGVEVLTASQNTVLPLPSKPTIPIEFSSALS
jgi:uncharacterized protein YuzE